MLIRQCARLLFQHQSLKETPLVLAKSAKIKDPDTGEDATAVLSAGRCLVVVFLVALYTGSRFGVVRRLKWDNVDFASRREETQVRQGRTGCGSVAYKTDVTKPIGSVKTGWKGAQCGIHDLRPTAPTRMLEAGYELQQVSSIMRWSASEEVRMARIYFHFTVERNRSAMEAIDVTASKPQPYRSPTRCLILSCWFDWLLR